MFWRFGGYANISAIDTLLEKPDVTLEELLEESDLIQELKSHNTKLIEYLREDAILQRLLEYVVAPKLETIASDEYDIDEDNNDDKGKEAEERSHLLTRMSSEDEEDDREKKRNRYAFVAAEILASDSWSLSAALLENEAFLRKFWEFLACPPPLDPLQAGYFTKVNEALLDKKTEEMLELFKSIPDVVENMLQHVDSPMVMDLLLKIISLEKAEGGQGIVDWLHSQDLMPTLLSFLSSEHSWATQTSAGDFLKAIITISANASQNEQSCIGPNELTRQLVSQPCVEKLITDMLKGGNPLTVGVGIVIEVIRKNNSDYDPEVGTEWQMAPSSRDPIYLGTLLRMFAKHVPDFMALILSPDHTIGSNDGPVTIKRKELNAAFGGKVEPLGFDRFKTCELMAELLHCSNMGLLNERGSEELVRARDAERERLRAEGKLASPGDRFNLESDDLTMRSSDTSRLGSHSPDEGRRLGVQNASDDDGFEEVTHAQDLGDDAKDDFDEKLDTEDELLANIKTENLPSFLDKDDDEFVDEPLSSPRLNTEVEALQPAAVDTSLTVAPLSPTKDLSEKVKDLDVSEEPKDADAKPPSYDDHSKDAPVYPDEQGKEALDAAISNQVEQEAAANAEEAVKTEGPVEATFEVSVRLETTEDVQTPHPDDRPAPLFSQKKTGTPEAEAPIAEAPEAEAPVVEGEPQSTVQEIASQVPIPEDVAVAAEFSGTEVEDSTMVDVDGTIRLDNADGTNPIEIEDDFSSSVVGDYLKMQFVEHRVVPTILDFFFRFPWNNFLHNVVYDVVQQVFNGPMDRGYNRNLAVDLFETGDITNRIVGGQNMSDEAQQLDRMRLGYMGHLTLIAEEVVKFTERHPPELLSELVLDKVLNLDWNHYVEVTLAETRERDNAILGGVRPDQNLGPRQAVMNAVNAASGGGSSALADAGLNGNSTLDGMDLSNGSGTSGSGFGLGGGSLLSGFGSSSDEEDEDMDEDMNDDDGMRGANVGGAEVGVFNSEILSLRRPHDDDDLDLELMNHEPPLAYGPLFPED
ncbi:hypothetical protein VC83_01263 [Pseudogymnoascus destructans]|uniref:Extragenic suppressor of kinetochore protein 1 n=1 Tax=Pseudogymnoascus destructans TaxID=655981 RepID=A0A177AN25_9PEZI|nr:uncharacterized protein VC83_01263 [Pseudogymnoascus destructans]OAF62731.2 hypothetical protein VC83_01263 [Pseudogymnoascus destructans]